MKFKYKLTIKIVKIGTLSNDLHSKTLHKFYFPNNVKIKMKLLTMELIHILLTKLVSLMKMI